MRKLAILFIILLGLGCTQEEPETNEPNENEVLEFELDPETIIINNSTNNLLVSINEDQLVFSSSNNQLDEVEVGSILASDMYSTAPNGYLRKVVSINNNGNQLTFNTEQASLAEAIENVDLSYQYSIADENVISIVDSIGATGNQQEFKIANKPSVRQSQQISISFQDVELYADGDHRISLDGSLALEFDIDFSLKIANNTLSEFQIVQNLTATADASLTASLQDLPSISEQKVLKTINLAPITIPVLGFPLPIAKQWIVIVLGVNGQISAGFQVGANNIYTMKAGVKYSSTNGWENIFETSNNFTPFYFKAFVQGELEGWIQARYEIRPYALSNSRIFLANKTGPKLEGSISTADPGSYEMTLSWCAESKAKAQIQIFDNTVANYDVTIYEDCAVIANWNGAADRNLMRVSSKHQMGIGGQPLSAPLIVKVVDADNQPVKGETILWEVTYGDGALASAETVTNSDGEAQNSWTIADNFYPNVSCSPNDQKVTATIANTDSSVEFTANKGLFQVKYGKFCYPNMPPVSGTIEVNIGGQSYATNISYANQAGCLNSEATAEIDFAIGDMSQPVPGYVRFNLPYTGNTHSFYILNGNVYVTSPDAEVGTCDRFVYFDETETTIQFNVHAE